MNQFLKVGTFIVIFVSLCLSIGAAILTLFTRVSNVEKDTNFNKETIVDIKTQRNQDREEYRASQKEINDKLTLILVGMQDKVDRADKKK